MSQTQPQKTLMERIRTTASRLDKDFLVLQEATRQAGDDVMPILHRYISISVQTAYMLSLADKENPRYERGQFMTNSIAEQQTKLSEAQSHRTARELVELLDSADAFCQNIEFHLAPALGMSIRPVAPR